MNPSHSPTLSFADPLRTPSKAAGASSDRHSDKRSSGSFSALYNSQTVSYGDPKQTKPNNINNLKNIDEKRKETTNTSSRAEENSSPVVDESTAQDDIDEIPTLSERDLAHEAQTFETELLHGISVALPSNSSQKDVGEKFPPSGKELPPNIEASNQALLQSKPTAEPELGEVLVRADSETEVWGRSDNSGRNVRLRHDAVGDLNPTRSDLSTNENRLETAQSKSLSEPLTESLSLLASKPLQEPATAPTAGNNSPTGLAAVVSQIDSTTAQKLSLAADLATNTDPNASTRGGSSDRANALVEKIHWMHNTKISSAELHLHPAELGSIEIKIVTEDQQARVSFITSSIASRDAIEESLPKLRELLADSGLALDQSDISQKDNGDEAAANDHRTLPENPHTERDRESEFTVSPISTRIGQVDHYV